MSQTDAMYDELPRNRGSAGGRVWGHPRCGACGQLQHTVSAVLASALAEVEGGAGGRPPPRRCDELVRGGQTGLAVGGRGENRDPVCHPPQTEPQGVAHPSAGDLRGQPYQRLLPGLRQAAAQPPPAGLGAPHSQSARLGGRV